MGPWLANNIRECDGLATMMSYWSLSDVFEEQGVMKTPFYGGYGLVAGRNLPKPAFRAFELLHRLGEKRLTSASENALVTERPDRSIVLALWNYAEPAETVPPKTFRLDLRGIRAKSYRMQFVDPEHGSSLFEWKKIGSPVSPTPMQIIQIQKASTHAGAKEYPVSDPIRIAPQGLALLELVPER